MGLNGSKFTRNDKLPGRGLQVLVDAKTLQVKQNQLDRLFHEFYKLSGEDYYKVDVEAFCAYHQVDYSPWCDLLFQMTEPDKSGEMDFYQYLVCSWNFLSTGEYVCVYVCSKIYHIFRRHFLVGLGHILTLSDSLKSPGLWFYHLFCSKYYIMPYIH